MKKACFVFPGQGSQYVGMGTESLKRSSMAARLFEEASDRAQIDIKKICLSSELAELSRTENAQPAILTASYASYLEIRSNFEIEPIAMAGHSLGEYTALVAAGVLSFGDGVALVRRRGQAMANLVQPSKTLMGAVLGVESDLVSLACIKHANLPHAFAAISSYNGPRETVVAGEVDALQAIREELEANGAKWVTLNSGLPFHTELMRGAAEVMREELKSIKFQAPHTLIFSNFTGRPINSSDSLAELLSEQIPHAVQWNRIMDGMLALPASLLIDVGPKAILANLFRAKEPQAAVRALDGEGGLQAFTRAENSAPLGLLKGALGLLASTPNIALSADRYAAEVIEPYRRIRSICQQAGEGLQILSSSLLREQLHSISSSLQAKGLTELEIRDALQSLRAEGEFQA